MVQAIESGFPQQEIGKSAYQYQQKLETQEEIIVGVNDFLAQDEGIVEVLKIDEHVAKDQIAKVRELRHTRDNSLLRHRLKQLENAARGKENLMPYILATVQAYGTIGEISDTLREVWGIYEEPAI
jgi:methylmalonyl-CoA mutase N-terminal domain/subunit